MKKLTYAGFTIVELLIASMVFTTILLLCMDGITRIAKVYLRSSSISRTNEFVKSFSGDIAQQIRYSASTPSTVEPSSNEYRVCVNGVAYKITFNTTNNAILKKTDSNCGSYNLSTFFDSESENFAPQGMRVLKFSVSSSVSPNGNIWGINIKVALAEPDLLVDANNKLYNAVGYKYSTARCRSGISGNEFCAVIELNTSVSRRMR